MKSFLAQINKLNPVEAIGRHRLFTYLSKSREIGARLDRQYISNLYKLGGASLFTAASLLLATASAQAAPVNLQFSGATCVTSVGTGCLGIGSIWRFNNIVIGGIAGSTQRDALVTISASSGGASVNNIDAPPPATNPLGSTVANFQPVVTSPSAANSSSYITFNIQFIAGGASLPATPIAIGGEVYVTPFDVDGDSGTLREMVEFSNPSSTYLQATTSLQLDTPTFSSPGTRYIAKDATTQPGIGTSDLYKATALYPASTTSFNLILGSKNGTSGCSSGSSCDRQTSISFSVSDIVPINDLAIAKSHTGNFTVGTPASYAITASNIGAAASGSIVIRDPLPTGLTIPNGAVAITGTNATAWTCTALSNVITCTSNTSIVAQGSSTFNITGIAVGSAAVPSVSNTATITTGGGSLTTNDAATDIATVNLPTDYGDAPASYGSASHTIVSGTQLGATVTAESADYNSTLADGDTGDDGITLNGAAIGTYVLKASTESATTNKISINPSKAGFASLWIDYNQNGTFDVGEQILNDQPVVSGAQDISFNVPKTAIPGYTFARVRYSTVAGKANTATGTAPDGEVEDYLFKVQKTTAPLACNTTSSVIYTSLDFRHFERVDSGTHWARRAGTLPNGKLVDVKFTRSSGSTLNASDTWDKNETVPTDAVTQVNSPPNVNRNFQLDVYEAGTTIPVVGNYVFRFADIDGHNQNGTRTTSMPSTTYTNSYEYQHFYGVAGYTISTDTKLYLDPTSKAPSDLFVQSAASDNPGYDTTLLPRQLAIRVAWENTSQMSFSYYSGQFGGTDIDGQGYNTAVGTENCNLTVNLSGTVFNDINSDKIQTGTEAGTNGGGLNAVLLNSSNVVVATTTVAADGTYSFSNVSPATYTVLITTGTTATITLPTNWVSTGENINGTPDTTVDSKVTATVTTSNVIANFGIHQNPADVLLLKRITAINGLSTNPNDNTTSLTGVLVDPNWKAGYVVGATDGGPVKPGDTIEYTIYYLNNGGRNAKSVRICDRLNANQTFYPDTYPVSTFIQNNTTNPNTPGSGMQVQKGNSAVLTLTNTSDSDGGQFVAATGTALPTNCNSVTGAPNNDYGALILDLVTNPGSPNLTTLPGRTGQGTPNDSFGLWRFITKVNKVSP